MGEVTSKNPPPGSERQIRNRKYLEKLEQLDCPSFGEGKQDATVIPDTKIDGDKNIDYMDPEVIKKLYAESQTDQDPVDLKALSIDPRDLEFPFENLVLEGGGTKGIAYCGVVKCLEELDMMKQIKRVGGASAGAMAATMIALGYHSSQIKEFLSVDMKCLFLDHTWGYLSLVPNVVNDFGWNPGKKIHKWFGETIAQRTGNPDTTFNELYMSRGVELCIVVTNVNLMRTEYCHPKTTPDMPIRDALRMTMSIPGVFAAVHYHNHGQIDTYVDGGVLCNYPINCFDGWFLSMKKEDAFLHKLKHLKEFCAEMNSKTRFKTEEPNKTMGFLLYNDSETEIMTLSLENRFGSLIPDKPRKETKLYRKIATKKHLAHKAHEDQKDMMAAVDAFLSALNRNNVSQMEFISKEDLKSTLEDSEFELKHRELLFGKDCSLATAFEIIDKDGNNKIAYNELVQFLEERGIRMQVRIQGYNRQEVDTFYSFVQAVDNAVLTNLKYISVNNSDEERTVGINTGHVGTQDFSLEAEDRDFAEERGYNATLSYLRYFAAKNPTRVKPRQSDVKTKKPVTMKGRDTDLDDVDMSGTSVEINRKSDVIVLNGKH